MILFMLASLVVFGDCIYKYTQGRGIDWRELLIGATMVAASVYFKTVKRPT
ncbi:MAG: hypothetical protein ABJF01_21925 [bacterium]